MIIDQNIHIRNDEKSNNIVLLSEHALLKKHDASYDTVLGMENAFSKCGSETVCFNKTVFYANRFLNRMFHLRLPDMLFNRSVYKADMLIYISMGVGNLKRCAATLKRQAKKGKKIVLYCFDTWESLYDEWGRAFREIKPYIIFFAYKKSAEYFSSEYKNVFWIPQAIDETVFYNDSKEKIIEHLFMQMGRKNLKIHEMILEYLRLKGLPETDENYVYQKEAGKIIYPEKEDLIRNICRTKYFVCAPQSVENSTLTGNISEVTARFYEAMACKTLIIGFKPDTFDTLFPADAMVDLKMDGSDFYQLIEFFNSHPEEYSRIVNRNYQLVRREHTWRKRVEKMLLIIASIDK